MESLYSRAYMLTVFEVNLHLNLQKYETRINTLNYKKRIQCVRHYQNRTNCRVLSKDQLEMLVIEKNLLSFSCNCTHN